MELGGASGPSGAGGEPSTPRSLRIRNRSGGLLHSSPSTRPQPSPSTRPQPSPSTRPQPSPSTRPQFQPPSLSRDSVSSYKKPSEDQQTADSLVEGRISEILTSLPVSNQYKLVKQIGEGTFSTVYLVERSKDSSKESAKSEDKLALKHLIPTSKPARVMMEIKCLQAAAGHSNIVPLLGLWRVGGDVVLAMPYTKHCKFVELVSSMDLAETRLYLGNLLSALQHIHKLGLIHRDIKPSNFLYDRDNKRFALVDFGLAQYENELKMAGGTQGRGTKRKGEEERETPSKKRAVLGDCENKLGCSPRARILRDHKQTMRRSPRKHDSSQEEVSSQRDVPRHKLSFGTPPSSIVATPPSSIVATPPSSIVATTPSSILTTPRSPSRTPSQLPAVRCSPRKLIPLARPAGFSKLTITGSTILSESPSIPSLPRSPSFTILEPASYTEMSGATSRTPFLRASVSSHCSSMLPRPATTPGSGHVAHVSHSCSCAGQLATCPACLALPHLHAARAGTPGFRPPEVLLKYPMQTTAVDLWAVGVILLCVLSRSYPFFRAPDDMTALAELSSLLGTAQIQAAANKYNRKVIVSHPREAPDLGDLCRRLSMRGDASTASILATDEAVSLLKMLLRLDHSDRITAAQALNHPFLAQIGP